MTKEEQFHIDIVWRIRELESTLYSAQKHSRADFNTPANTWAGAFSSLDSSIRFYDVQDYIDWLKEKYEKD